MKLNVDKEADALYLLLSPAVKQSPRIPRLDA